MMARYLYINDVIIEQSEVTQQSPLVQLPTWALGQACRNSTKAQKHQKVVCKLLPKYFKTLGESPDS